MNRISNRMTVIGIGASAGGLTALKTLFSHIPKEPGVAFVVVMHLSPEYESHLAELLQPHCAMPVEQVNGDLPLELNRVYVIPPNANLDSVDTHLRLSKLESARRNRAPIDHFFRTLAETHDGHAIGVLLSGTGSDGTLGLRKINENRGLVLVQSPEEAEYDGMPRNAIASGAVDEVLPLHLIPGAIKAFTDTEPNLRFSEDGESLLEDGERHLRKIFAQIRVHTGHDFSKYKRSTLMRRIERRMQLQSIEQLSDYVKVLSGQREEVGRLFDDLLITVTEFFRDREVFDHLSKEVLPGLFSEKNTDDQVRVWSAGCATGEEAYSLAMLLMEASGKRGIHPQLQVFATDLQDKALVTAREGIYPETISAHLDDKRLKRFFDRENGSYRVKRELREIVVFAEHNLLRDPPFSRLDMVVCRNMLIYLQRDIQKEVMSILHYALKPGGLLLLGNSESVDPSDLFIPENKSCSLFRRRDVPAGGGHLTIYPFSPKKAPAVGFSDSRGGHDQSYGSLHAEMVEQYAPPSVLISHNYDVVHSSAQAGRYMKMPGGEPTRNIFKLVDERLRIELQTLLHSLGDSPMHFQTKEIPLILDGENRGLILRVRTADEGALRGYYLLMFEERPTEGQPTEARSVPSASEEDLRAELEHARQRLQAVVEQYESSQEEMQASNEELQSTNEELRSTMEELETSKEELQSMNEELTTLNQENRHRVEELKQLSGDLENLLTATNIATLFLDRELHIVRFTPKIGELFNVRHSDRGRPLSDFTHRLGELNLHQDAAGVLETLQPSERVLHSDEGMWYLCRMLPYRTPSKDVEGVVITLIDITDRKRSEEQMQEARDYAEAIVETLTEPLVVMGSDLSVKTVNARFCEQFRVDRDRILGRTFYSLDNSRWDLPELRKLLEEVLPENHAFYGYQIEIQFESMGKRALLVNARQLPSLQMILMSIQDITERDNAQQALAQRTAKMEEQKFQLQHLAKELAAAEHRERKRLAALLHDELQQHLVAMRLHLCEARAEENAPRVEQYLDKAEEVLKLAMQSSRHLTRQLRPPVLYEAGLIPALRWQAAEMEKLHEISISVESDVEELQLDDDMRAMVFECVRELLFNVVKHAQVEEAHVGIRLENRLLKVVIIDHGVGFDAEIMKQNKTDGGGMGLFSIRERLKASGGNLHVGSIPGDGTEIILETPLGPVLDGDELEDDETLNRMLPDSPKRSPDSIRVVVADDHHVVREGLVTLIRSSPLIQVVGQAEDGVQALEIVGQLQPDIVLMDINMPKMNGLEATKKIRRRWPHIEVIGLSVQDDEATVQSVKDAGAALFISKSETAKTMVRAILELRDIPAS